ncbi:TetR family transcriptional regulator [Streptomyces albiflaviniger]|nr:TetR family transcriptional regulator [Streptomyces albiflaviniger]
MVRSVGEAEREREILDVTFDLVAEVGYEEATVDEVARRAKASTAAPASWAAV